MTRFDVKKDKQGKLHPFDFPVLYEKTGDTKYLKLWWEYEESTHRKRAISYSKGLKRYLGIGEKTDEELLEEREDGCDVMEFESEEWKIVCMFSLEMDIRQLSDSLPSDKAREAIRHLLNYHTLHPT